MRAITKARALNGIRVLQLVAQTCYVVMLCRGLAVLAIMSNTARTASASGASAAKKARTASASEASTQERYSRLMMVNKESFVSRTGMAKLMPTVD